MSDFVRPYRHPGRPPGWRGNSNVRPRLPINSQTGPPTGNRFQDVSGPPFYAGGHGFDLSRPPQFSGFHNPPPSVPPRATVPQHGFSVPPPNHFITGEGQRPPMLESTIGPSPGMNIGMRYATPPPPTYSGNQVLHVPPFNTMPSSQMPQHGFPTNSHHQQQGAQTGDKTIIQMELREKESGSHLLDKWLHKRGKTKSQLGKPAEVQVQPHQMINGLRSMVHLLNTMSEQVKDITNSSSSMNSSFWENSKESLESAKDEVMKLDFLLDESTVKVTEQHLSNIRRKRARLKQARKNKYDEKQRLEQVREEKSLQIDRWQERHRAQIREENQRKSRKAAADRTLSKVTREIQDATRLIETMLALQKLRLIRRDAAQKRGETELGESRQTFEQKITDMTRLVQAQLECYKEEEAKLKAVIKTEQEESRKQEKLEQAEKEMEKQMEEDKDLQSMLFGSQDEISGGDLLFPYAQYYRQAENNLQSFLQIRQEWDTFLVPEGTPASSTVPSSWVTPDLPSSGMWAAALK